CITREQTGPVDPDAPVISWFPTLFTPFRTIERTRTARGSHAAVNLCEEWRRKSPSGGRAISERFAFITVGKNHDRSLSASWWLSRNVQKYLGSQLDAPINADEFLKIRELLKIEKPSQQAGLPTGPQFR